MITAGHMARVSLLVAFACAVMTPPAGAADWSVNPKVEVWGTAAGIFETQ